VTLYCLKESILKNWLKESILKNLYLMNTRPDICFVVNILSQYME
jgi:hypothetical protein